MGLGKPWESESSSDSDLDDFITKRRFDAEEAVSESNDIFVLASQRFEEEYCKDKSPVSDTDEILLLASQQFEENYGGKEMSEVDGVLRYGSPKTSKQIDDVRKLGVPVKTRDQNKWVCRIFSDWAQYRLQSVCVEEEEKQHLLVEDFCKMRVRDMNFWLLKFVLEVRRRDGQPYSPETLYQICCGLLRLLKDAIELK